MTYKATFFAAVVAAAALGLGATANAAPLSPVQKAMDAQTQNLQKVDWRGYRHCHWRNGRRWCHGGYGYRRGYYGYRRPGVSLYIGPRWGWGRRHWRYRRW
jgi:hypothetical protein